MFTVIDYHLKQTSDGLSYPCARCWTAPLHESWEVNLKYACRYTCGFCGASDTISAENLARHLPFKSIYAPNKPWSDLHRWKHRSTTHTHMLDGLTPYCICDLLLCCSPASSVNVPPPLFASIWQSSGQMGGGSFSRGSGSSGRNIWPLRIKRIYVWCVRG